MKLFYAEPASKWEETLPIGNGSLGAMIWGSIKRECLGLNERVSGQVTAMTKTIIMHFLIWNSAADWWSRRSTYRQRN